MIFTERMEQLTAVVLSTQREQVAEALLEEGVMDFLSVEQFASSMALSRSRRGDNLAALSDARMHLEALLKDAQIALPSRVEPSHQEIAMPELLERISQAESYILSLRQDQKLATEELSTLEEIKRHLPNNQDLTPGLYTYLRLHTGRTEELKALKAALKDVRHVLLERDWGLILLHFDRDKLLVEKAMREASWQDELAPEGISSTALSSELSTMMLERKNLQASIQKDLKLKLVEKSPELLEDWCLVRAAEVGSELEGHFAETKKAVVFSGWVPSSRIDAVIACINKASDNCAMIERTPREEQEGKPPVAIKNNRFIKIFQPIVYNYDVPDYGVINPTPFVAISYLLMFGLMFGDVGHGLVVALLAAFMIYKRKQQGKDGGLFNVFFFCGLSAMFFGALFGSYFGFSPLPPLWFDYHSVAMGHGNPTGSGIVSVNDILTITIFLGIAILGTGLVINWINLIRRKEWFKLLWDKNGLLGGWIYAFGLYILFFMSASGFKTLPASWILFLGFALPAFLLFIKMPVEEYFERRAGHEVEPFSGMKVLLIFVMWFVEILEYFLGYLSNTLSFLRVAGMGLAHVILMSAFFEVALMLSPGASGGTGYSLMGWVMIVLGNIIVIGLEGLSSGIQALRLNYYEFFSKYFIGGGQLYRPLSYKTREE